MTALSNRARVVAVCIFASAILAVLIVSLALGQHSIEGQTTAPPNVVLILSDDQPEETLAHMPRVQDLLVSDGAKLQNMVSVFPLCCPARATLQRGQYAHNTKVLGNYAKQGGGWPVFDLNELEHSTVGTWVHDAGYRTAHIGKYMNQYNTLRVPPGWDRWWTLMIDKYGTSDPFVVNAQGVERSYPGIDKDVLIADKALSWTRDVAPKQRPFFMQVGFTAPHAPANYESKYSTAFSTEKVPRTPNYNEVDLSDKSSWIANRPIVGNSTIGSYDTQYRNRLRDLQTVDAFVSDLHDALDAAGEWENTYVLYYTDNGWHWANHRLKSGKLTYFEEDTSFPMIVRGPGIAPGATRSLLIGNHDVAPTIADMANATVPDFVDGRSALPVLEGVQDGATWRSVIYSERRWAGTDPPTDGNNYIPDWEMVRTETNKYVKIKDDPSTAALDPAEEFYDLSTDPYETSSLVKNGSVPETTLDQYRARLAELRGCKGSVCRAAENVPVP